MTHLLLVALETIALVSAVLAIAYVVLLVALYREPK
jgi:hypothetical protein